MNGSCRNRELLFKISTLHFPGNFANSYFCAQAIAFAAYCCPLSCEATYSMALFSLAISLLSGIGKQMIH